VLEYPAVPVKSVEYIFTPGAPTSRPVPKLEPQKFSPSQEVVVFRVLHILIAATEITLVSVAGYCTELFEFPAAKSTAVPLPPRPLVVAVLMALVIVDDTLPPPHELLITSAPAVFQA
jgi:hypothetical protein